MNFVSLCIKPFNIHSVGYVRRIVLNYFKDSAEGIIRFATCD
jgi:hypothetical protein